MVGSKDPKGYHHDTDAPYRYLDGHKGGQGMSVTAIGDDDWEYTASFFDHNEYLGVDVGGKKRGGFKNAGATMTGYCTGCHGEFHKQVSRGSWVRHPSDAVIPNSGEFANSFDLPFYVGLYDPAIPVAKETIGVYSGLGIADPLVRKGKDMVMCLSCHKAHGSPYPDMLRWDPVDMTSGNPDNGCIKCHTEK